MDRLSKYREIVKNLIRDYARHKPAVGEVEIETIFDESHDHYELMYSGWHKRRRIHGCVIHVDIREGKIVVQHDGTESGIAQELLEAGVEREHIVLAFHSPELRKKYTDYAAV